MLTRNDLKKQYKKPPSTFNTARKIRISLGHEQREKRRKRRTQDFEENRKENPPRSAVSQNNEPRTKLFDWKTEREKKKKTQESQKKPPFVVGIVRHHVYSPIVSTSANSVASTGKKKTVEQAHKSSSIKRGITKATEKRLLAKAAAANRKTHANSASKKSMNDKVESVVIKRKSFAPPNYKFNPPAGLPEISLFSKACIEDSEDLNKNNIFACNKSSETDQISIRCNFNSVESITLKVSPYKQETSDSQKKQTSSTENSTSNNSNVKFLSLGFSLNTSAAVKKENCSKDLISFPNLNTEDNVKSNKQNDFDFYQASGSSGLSDKLATKSAIMKNPDLSISPIGEKKYTVKCFECMLNKEKNRLQKLCEKWTEIQLQDGIAEDILCRINQAVGQTTMLIKEKFKQFQGLILDCERNDGDMLVTCTDLHGFWDMMYIEVKDCDSRFAKLEELRARHWQEDQSSFFTSSTKPKKKIIVKKKIVPTKQNSLRALILSNRKKKMAEDNDENSQQINVNDKCVTPCITNKRTVSVLRKSSNITRDKRSLEPANWMYTSTPLPDVTSNVSSQPCTPLITMKVSQLYNKSMMQLDNTMLFGQTPGLTPRSSIERSERKNVRIKACKTNLDDHLAKTRSFDEKLKIDQNSGTSSTKNEEMKKSDNLDSVKRNHTEEKSDSASDGSAKTVIENTVIENTVREESNTLSSFSRNTDSNRTPERKKSVKEFSNKNLKTKLFRKSSMHPIGKSPSGTPPMINNLPTTRDASLNHYVGNNINSNKIMPRTDRVAEKCNSSMKISWNRAIISDGTFKVSKSIERESTKTAEASDIDEEYTNADNRLIKEF